MQRFNPIRLVTLSSGQTNDKKNASAEQSGSGEKNSVQGDDAHGDSEKKDEVVLEDNQKGQGDDAHGDSEKKDKVVLEDNQKGQGDDAHGDSEKKDEVVLEDNQNGGQGESHNGEDDIHPDDSEKKELSAESQNGDDDVPPLVTVIRTTFQLKTKMVSVLKAPMVTV